MDKDSVLKLAKLARIDMPDAEAESLSHEFERILKYVGEIKSADLSQPSPKLGEGGPLAVGEVNIMRDDTNPHKSGIYTEAILKEAPNTKGEYIRVKKIL